MEFFSSSGIIAQLVALPFIIMALRKWRFANQSKNWLKTKGKVIIGLDFSMTGHIKFLYEYKINGIKYHGKKPFFTNSFKNLRGKKSWELIEKYPSGKEIDVYYNSTNPKISTLEPGRKDGLITTLIFMLLLFILGFISQHYPSILYQFLDYFNF